jgi:hypothetical protein
LPATPLESNTLMCTRPGDASAVSSATAGGCSLS